MRAHTDIPQNPAIFPRCAGALIACIFFFVSGLALIPRLGIENDEALFALAIYRPRAELYAIHVGRSHIPLMVLNYLGALKSLIYKPILLIFGSGIFALRVPMLLAGTISVWLFYLLLRRVAGERAAYIGCALLAVDSTYLVTVCFDWGPVAMQHLFTIGGMLLLVRFYQRRESWALAGGCLLFGLALWDKALAIWLSSGLAVAAMLTLRRQIFDTFSVRRLVVAVAAFTLGASPLLLYNAENHWGTFHGNLVRDTQHFTGKAQFLLDTERTGLFGWLTSEDWRTPRPQPPNGPIQAASAKISALAGKPHDFPLHYAFALALLLAPLAGRNGLRAILFSLIAMTVAWVQMAINANTGAAAHHTILLWPLPELIIAISFAAASRRLGRAGIPALGAAMAVMLIAGALVINEYHAEMVRYGGAQSWNEAILPLSDYLKGVPAQNVICLDWGVMDSLRLLSRGNLPLISGYDPVMKPPTTDDDRRVALWLLALPESVFIAHTKDFEFFHGPSPNLTQFAEKSGYRRTPMATISDHYGRPFYEVFRFVGGPPPVGQ